MQGHLNSTNVTEQTIREDAEDSLADYYKRKQKLTEYIVTAHELIETSKQEIKELDKQYSKQLKIRGRDKPRLAKVFDFIKNNPGLERRDLTGLLVEQVLREETVNSVSILVAELHNTKHIEKRDNGTIYAIENEYRKRPYTQGAIAEIVRSVLKDKITVSAPNILEEVKVTLPKTNYQNIHGVLRYLIKKKQVTTNRAYKNQFNILYTWIGENNV